MKVYIFHLTIVDHSNVDDFALLFFLFVDICTIKDRNNSPYKRWANFLDDESSNRFLVTWRVLLKSVVFIIQFLKK